MGTQRFEITIVSADNLPDHRLIGQIKVYALVSLNGAMMHSTYTDYEGGTNPRWDSSFVFTIAESDLQRSGLNVVVELFHERIILGGKFIGHTVIPVKSLFEKGLRSQRVLSYPIVGTDYGRLNIRYWFEEKYPPPQRSVSGGGGDLLWTALRVAWAAHTGDISSFFN